VRYIPTDRTNSGAPAALVDEKLVKIHLEEYADLLTGPFAAAVARLCYEVEFLRKAKMEAEDRANDLAVRLCEAEERLEALK
jgi:hypothetical protein